MPCCGPWPVPAAVLGMTEETAEEGSRSIQSAVLQATLNFEDPGNSVFACVSVLGLPGKLRILSGGDTSAGGWRCEMRVWAGLRPSSRPLPGLWWPRTVLGLQVSSFCVFASCPLSTSCLCPHFLLIRTLVVWGQGPPE